MMCITLASCLTPVASSHYSLVRPPYSHHSVAGFRGHDLLNDLNPLILKKIKIGPSCAAVPQNPTTTTDSVGIAITPEAGTDRSPPLPQSLRRAGNYLLRLLRIEYEQRNSPIADLEAEEALSQLKDQVVAFATGGYPFNRTFSPSQTPFEWWRALDEDKSTPEAQPLAVSSLIQVPDSVLYPKGVKAEMFIL